MNQLLTASYKLESIWVVKDILFWNFLGVRAFESLTDLLHECKHDALRYGKLTEDQIGNIQYCLEAALQYFQNNYVFNLSHDSSIKTHNLNWLLSDSKDENFQNPCTQDFEGTCEFCDLVPTISMQLMSVCEQLEQDPLFSDKPRIEKWRYTINQSELAIQEYRNFIVRNKMSDMDWNSRFSTERPQCANVIFDFAMNHLPEKPRLVMLCKPKFNWYFNLFPSNLFNNVINWENWYKAWNDNLCKGLIIFVLCFHSQLQTEWFGELLSL